MPNRGEAEQYLQCIRLFQKVAIIPARDESSRIPRVLAAATAAAQSGFLDRVVVAIDARDKEGTGIVARRHGVEVLSVPPSCTTKGAIMRWAVSELGLSARDIVVFADADHTGVNPECFIIPLLHVARTQAMMSVVPYEKYWTALYWRIARRILPFAPHLTGCRAVRVQLIHQLDPRDLDHDAPEVNLDLACGWSYKRPRWVVAFCRISGFGNPSKFEKYSSFRGALRSKARVFVAVLKAPVRHILPTRLKPLIP